MEVVPAGPADPSVWADVLGITDDDLSPSAAAELRIVLVPDGPLMTGKIKRAGPPDGALG